MIKLKKLPHCVSPFSWLFIVYGVYVTLYILLKATPKDFLIMAGVDWVAYLFNSQLEGRIFQRLFPDTTLYFESLQEAKIQKLTTDQRTELLESFFKFPRRRAIYATLGSFIKVIPALFVIVFVWEHSISNLAQLALALGITCMNFGYFYGAVFLESHIFLSRTIHELHEKYDFSESFKKVNLPCSRREFEVQGFLFNCSILLFVLALQGTIIISHSYSDESDLMLKLLLVAASGALLHSRLWYLTRSLLLDGLEAIFKRMEFVDYKSLWKDLPLHSSPLLAQFERSFNLLSTRVRQSEQELSSMVLHEADESRYRTIGEMSALIAHDLSGPLHLIQFCADELRIDREPQRREILLERLARNSTRAIELTTSLKARIKNTNTDPFISQFSEAHQHVVRLMETQFPREAFSLISFKVEPAVSSIILEMPQIDLIHILDNLYRNSVKNLLDHKVAHPEISAKLLQTHDDHADFVQLSISDNGTGLSLDRFEQLTAFRFTEVAQGSIPVQEGLGLRLIRRLIELRGGELNVLPTQRNSGTTFCLKLRLKKSEEKPLSVRPARSRYGMHQEIQATL